MNSQFLMPVLATLALRSPSWGKPIFVAGLRLIRKPLTARFVKYAIDFEVSCKTDDWSGVDGYFTPDAIYRVRNSSFDCELRQRDNIILGFKRSLDGFDRKLNRSPRVVEGPSEKGNTVTFIWSVKYSKDDCPPLELSATQTAHYRDGLIELLTDEYLPGHGDKAAEWMKEHSPDVDPSYREVEPADPSVV